VPVKAIKTTAVEAWISEMRVGTAISAHTYMKQRGKPASASTVLRNLGVLAGILDNAVKDKRLSKNPARGADNLPKKSSKKRKRYLTHEEVDRFASAAATGSVSTLILTLAYTGLRWGEAGALKVRSVDFLRKRLRVRQSATWVQRECHLGSVKSWESRDVAIADFLLPLLARECEGKGPDDLLFEDPERGGYLYPPDLRSNRNGWWIRMCRDADLERLTPHDMRHTYASLSVSSGANVKALQKSLGHKSAAMTLDIYSDLFDSDLDQVAQALNQARSAAVVSTECPDEPEDEASPA
jgi:integrase